MKVEDQAIIDEYYNALVDRDSKYIGIFYVGVTTTSVFCISTCRARKPKKKNVEFYKNYEDALKSGYRPCKICCPTENANQPPNQVLQAIQLVKDHPKKKITDQILREQGISPDITRRWFNKNYRLTFHAFQRMYRINNAYKELKDGKKATDTAYDSGYESLSGFGYTYKKILGKSPKSVDTNNIILINRLLTPLGPMFVCATERGICLLEFTDRKMLESEFEDLQRKFKARIFIGENKHISKLKLELKEYFEGLRTNFNSMLDTPGTLFQQQVWSQLNQIPYGTVATYHQIAQQIENEKAVRAVGRANGLNKVSIVIPCHRVIGQDGTLTGYGGGIERKKWLLDHEKKHTKHY